MSRDNEKYVCPLCLQSSSDQFIQWPIPDQSLLLFSGAPALVLSFVTLYLMYMMKLYTGMKPIPGHFWLLWKGFVLELSHLYQAYADCSSLKSITLKACSVLVASTLQKPNRTSKSKDHVAHLNRRLALWKEGNLSALLDEG